MCVNQASTLQIEDRIRSLHFFSIPRAKQWESVIRDQNNYDIPAWIINESTY